MASLNTIPFLSSQKLKTLWLVAVVVGVIGVAEGKNGRNWYESQYSGREYSAISNRAHSASIKDFGGVGDGKTLNTKAFREAMNNLSKYSAHGGAKLIVPAGKWLTGSFNLTSHFTLFLDKDAVLLASLDVNTWQVVPPLPSYGSARDASLRRYISFIFGSNLVDVVITGNNGTIDGQGAFWWQQFRSKKLKYIRPNLIEIMHTDNLQISNITLLNSPNWNVHPVYSSNIIIQGLTILAPVKSANTDGINPDSCTKVRIEDNYIVSGDDCVAIKSGIDEYGIKVGMPTKQLIIRRLTCISPTSGAIAMGSEMSGGIEDVRASDITAVDTESGVRIKTALGRGGYVKNIYVKGLRAHTMKLLFQMTGKYGSHADKNFDPKAIPVVAGINFRDVVADNVTTAGTMEGVPGHPFTGICMANVTIGMAKNAKKQPPWVCTNIQGVASGVVPPPCNLLHSQGPVKPGMCDLPAKNG